MANDESPCLRSASGPLHQWTDWVPLLGAGRDRSIPSGPGLYRVRRVGSSGLDYIGQAGRSLRGRLGMLAGVHRSEMPYRDPHTAAPALWAIRHCEGCEFEASVTLVPGSVVKRKALEAVAITLYRVETGRSPTFNFGRMPPGYRASSANNARLVAAGGRVRGGPEPRAVDAPPSVPVSRLRPHIQLCSVRGAVRDLRSQTHLSRDQGLKQSGGLRARGTVGFGQALSLTWSGVGD